MYLTFSRPEFLWYLLSIPLLVVSHFAFLEYAKKRAMRFANFEALKRISDERIMTKNHLILIIRLLILVSLIFSISGTTLWYLGLTDSNDYIIAIDASASMTAQDFLPSRIDAAKTYTLAFVDKVKPNSKIGLISFSGSSFIESLPSKERTAMKDAVNELSISNAGGTNIPDAIVTATNLLIPSTNGKTIILLTDGSNTGGYFTKDPIGEGINHAKQNNVIIYTIGVGSDSGPIGYLPEYYNVSSVYDESILFRMANSTGGLHFNALNNKDLDAAYTAILSDSKKAYVDIDLSMGMLIMVLGLLFLEWGLISTRYRALP